MTEFRRQVVTFILCLIATAVFGQSKSFTIHGVVTDDHGQPIELATVSLNQSIATTTDRNGKYELRGVPAGQHAYRVSYVGYEALTGVVVVKNSPVTLNLKMHELGLELANVVVTAKQVQMGSKSLIDKDAIRHIQPKSIGDMLQLVPGNLIENPNLNSLSQAHIREIGVEENNALGTLVMVDGTPLSNDANLEVFNATLYGTSADGNGITVGENTTGGRGVDLRTVSAGNVESMEVIRGIPSVEYGNLTSGVVIVNTKSGHTPWEAKFSADPNSKLAYLGKGFNLSGGGAVNFAVDWAQSWADPRLHYKGYDRITASAGYSNKFGRTTFNVRGAFYSNINNTKRDVQMTEANSEWKNNNTGGRLAINGRYTGESSFVSSVDYKLSAQMNRQHDWKSDWISNPEGVITDTRQQGLQEARFKRYGYHSEYTIESIPLNLYAQLVANKYVQLSENNYTNVKLGAEFTYDGNSGDGLKYDIENPPQSVGTQKTRPRAYDDIPALKTLSVFLSDRLNVQFGTVKAQVEAGVRLSDLLLDEQKSGGNSGYFVVEPRVNASVSLLNSRNNRLLDDLSVTGGFGLSNKMPPLLYLYPNAAYFDNVALARWTDREDDRLALVQTTIVSHTQNADLKPAHSRKWEVGLQVRKGQVNASVTYFNERHDREYGFASQLLWYDYPYFELPAGATASRFDAATGNVTYTAADGTPATATKHVYTERIGWGLPQNVWLTQKHGIEYTLGLGEWKPIRTSLNISGAWFWVKRTAKVPDNSNTHYDSRLPSANQYCVVNPSGAGSIMDRVSTNFAFITHIPAVKVIVTTNVQVVWRLGERTIYEDENGNSRYYRKSYSERDYMVVDPLGYYDMEGKWSDWQPSDADNNALGSYVSRLQLYDLDASVEKPWAMLSMRLTKEIGKTAELSFIANNLTNSRKYRRFSTSNLQYQSYPPMYFGGEVKLKF